MASLAKYCVALSVFATARLAHGKDGFVFLGATGDNAIRPSGVWQGLYEAFAGGVLDPDKVGLHVAMDTPHTKAELDGLVNKTLTPLHESLQKNPGWKCRTKDGDCSPQRLIDSVELNIWKGRDANDQAANMTTSLSGYNRITVYLSLPPFVFGSWSKAAVDNWGEGAKHRVHVAAEKPFGTSLEDAEMLHKEITDAGVPDENIHLVDHWLSFFMNRHLPNFRKIVQPLLGVEWSTKHFSKIVVTEFETRGLDGRGAFFDGVGQLRDMVQSHLLQVLALALIGPDVEDRTEAKLAIFNKTSVTGCHLNQYDGFLFEPKLKYHNASADATLCKVELSVDHSDWKDVEMVITTGKNMGTTLYTIDFFQRDGSGVLTYEIGKEETGQGGIKVKSWPLKDPEAFQAPLPGFDDSKTVEKQPTVTAAGDGYILNYNDTGLYFPQAYSTMAAALITADYTKAFVTWPECQRSWTIVTASSPKVCLDPTPDTVAVYKPPAACGNIPPNVCMEKETVADLYDKTFACTPAHDAMYKTVSLYQAKCHPAPLIEFVV